jgi:hypothetical protein
MDRPNHENIAGWGMDADPENEPTYPIKHYTGDDHKRLNWERPPLQPVTVEVLHSNERPNVSAVFGTVAPPKGLSGSIRRFAFKYSENSYLHWLPLLLADRVNVVEGYIEDISRGYIPNVFAERGWKAFWQHDPKQLAKKVAIMLTVGAGIAALLGRKGKAAYE